MMKRSVTTLALLALLPLSAAHADDKLSYSYIEGGYYNFDGEADGFGLRGSIEFGASDFYGFGGFSQLEIDNSNIDFDSYNLGLGYAHSLSENADLISELSYVNSEIGHFDTDGYRVSVGLRGSMGNNFEGIVKANYTDRQDFGDGFSGTLGAQYKFSQTWGVTGEIEFDDDAHTYLVGLRASF